MQTSAVVRPFHDPELRFRSAPRLETERLVLRAFELDDLDYFLDFFGDGEAAKYVGGASGPEDAYRRMLAGSAFWPLLGIGMWMVEDRANGATIGHVGLFDFLREVEPSIVGEVEMGWILAPVAHGKGLAEEACRAILGWFEEHFGVRKIYATIAPGNEPSMRLAKKLGFTRQPDGIYRDEPQTIWVREA